MRENRRKRVSISVLLLFIITTVVILAIMFWYANKHEELTKQQIEQTICQNTKDVSKVIDTSLEYALSSIQVTATAVANTMNGEELKNPSKVLEKVQGNTPFSAIEYIRADGTNMTNAGDPFDASAREYYIQGIQGKTGIWINYTPKYSKEPLLNVYTPLYYEGSIVGVITGTMGGNTNIRPLMISQFYDQKEAGILLDEKNQIIASTEQFSAGTILNWETLSVAEADKSFFLDAVEKAEDTIFHVSGNGGQSIGSVSKISSTGWKVIQIVPATSIRAIVQQSQNVTFWSIGGVLLVSVLFFVFLLVQNARISKMTIRRANVERDEQFEALSSMADVFYSMHVLHLGENTLVEYAAHNEVKAASQNKKDAIESMKEVMHATMSKEYLEAGLEFSDLTTLAERMKGKKYLAKELQGRNVGWIRLAFITIKEDSDGYPIKLLCTTQIIEDDKKKEETLVLKSNTDEMTRLYNRRAYEEDLVEFSEKMPEEPIVYVAIDINGLKNVNDTLGHEAGDELIRGAAGCLEKAFAKFGRVYRTGGDEFVAILHMNEERLAKVKIVLEEMAVCWSGNLVKELAMSCGYVSTEEFSDKTILEISRIADQRMYEAKSSYYRNKGVDRRGQMAAHTALCALYTKILKINLTDDSYQIVQMDMSEQTTEKGFSNRISAWLEDFGRSGQVHKDDLQSYLVKTNMGYLKKYFCENKTSLSIFYRRNMDGVYKEAVMEMIPADDYTPENQSVFLYVKAIDK